MWNKLCHRMATTDSLREYKRLRRVYLHRIRETSCDWCPPHSGCHRFFARWRPERNWKEFRKRQYKPTSGN